MYGWGKSPFNRKSEVHMSLLWETGFCLQLSGKERERESEREWYLIEVLDNISLQFCDESSALVTGHCCCQLLSNLSWKTAYTSFIGIWPIKWEHRNKWGNQSMLNTLKTITGTKSSNNVLAHLTIILMATIFLKQGHWENSLSFI